jgi:hypothetical protein
MVTVPNVEWADSGRRDRSGETRSGDHRSADQQYSGSRQGKPGPSERRLCGAGFSGKHGDFFRARNGIRA